VTGIRSGFRDALQAAGIAATVGRRRQKPILGLRHEAGPGRGLANRPVRGLDTGAIAWVHGEMSAARDRDAAAILISEDLNEVTRLSDVLHGFSVGRRLPPLPRRLAAVAFGSGMAVRAADAAPVGLAPHVPGLGALVLVSRRA